MGTPKTLRNKVDRFKARTPQGALLELTRLTQEKMRLQEETKRWERRMAEIRSRLTEIAEMEVWLYRFIENPFHERPDAPHEAEGESPAADGQRPPLALQGLNEVTIRY
jgi:predicted nuclease with TOPRIM domain